ncbi:hypothetical protein A3C59_00470 [Candidatus Daviesbacteria bacterium RIFCSPHIGHO2_02_FULL_36_13]|uniref:MalT-like TPR region domain-containing protein n=1 Tax=Candidatus Daviesbacteria bacterium RIFCSPHIGHO2_02_FULL_36_13 TaxID=1797768 RepID=A0A1F5JPB4_9BACT|nr:MAG: hypothetical protein A3C59_00470 [Candidatus Daviesbacteria bacterium RIFCSPHIGHO2_02_FULL_36_13]OGE43771.1 MAG: hypothetical protein A3A45_00235 [Candidatus Daviesbacteria bacterium RIFCSPLOWO2_01_FULL_36_8]
MANPEQGQTPDTFTQSLDAARNLQVTNDHQGSIAAYKALMAQYGERSEALNGIVVSLRVTGQHTEAFADVNKAKIFSQQNYLTALANGIDVLRTGHRAKDGFPGQNFNKALEYMREAEDLMSHMPDASIATVHAFTNFGLLHNDMGNLDLALAAYSNAEIEARELVGKVPANPEYQNRLARALHTEGVTQEKLGMIDEAEISQDEALPIFTEQGDIRNICNVLISKGDIASKRADPELSRSHWEKGLRVAQENGEQTMIGIFTEKLAQLQPPPTES